MKNKVSFLALIVILFLSFMLFAEPSYNRVEGDSEVDE